MLVLHETRNSHHFIIIIIFLFRLSYTLECVRRCIQLAEFFSKIPCPGRHEVKAPNLSNRHRQAPSMSFLDDPSSFFQQLENLKYFW